MGMKKATGDDRRVLIDVQSAPSRRWTRFTHRSKSSSILTFLFAVTVFMLIFFLLFRALDVLPRKINVFWISEDTLSSLKIDIQFIGQKNDTGVADTFKKTQIVSSLCNDVPDVDKFDCYPEGNSNEQDCINRGCCWKSLNKKRFGLPPLSTPYCFYPPDYNGYQFHAKSERPDGFTLNLSRQQPSGFPKDIQNVIVNVTFLDNNSLRIKVSDANKNRYEVPVPQIREVSDKNIESRKYLVQNDNNHVWISRVSTGTILFNLSLSTLIFSDQMHQASVKLPSHYVYGIGDNKDRLLRGTNWKRYVLFARDRIPEANKNLYSSHPFYLVLEKDGKSHGVLLLNSNPMEIVIQPTPAITLRPIGGILDFYITVGPSPGDAVSQYTALIGRSFMPPYWSLGFHLCRLGYNSVNKTREVWKRTRDHGIPFDTQWNDIDHMDKYNDFTLNASTFGGLPKFVQELHDFDMHYIMIIDPGISNAEPPGTYPPFDDGLSMDIFIKNASGSLQIAKVWNRVSTVFPDFTNPKTVDYWTKQFQSFHKVVPFDGVWIDMNEPSNFVDGSIYGCPEESSLEDPPFVPGSLEPLRTKTLCMTSKQYASVHYNVHNIHGLTEVIATNKALKTVLDKRPFIISRSTFPGSGHYGGTWDGDVISTWDHMQWTIPSILTLNMLGVSMAGADICGFNGNTTVELCARWSALGAFYPFSRNHNSDDTIEQDPVALGEEVISSARNMLTVRYGMLPILYTLFYRSHVFGETVVRPMFFEFPYDVETYALDQQFMWGSHILIIPALQPGQTEVTGYLPKGRWYPLLEADGEIIVSKGENKTFSTPLNSTNILVREGSVLVTQWPKHTTAACRKELFYIAVIADKSGNAKGELYWDDGVSVDSYEKGLYSLIEFSTTNTSFTSQPVKKGFRDMLEVNLINLFKAFPKKPASMKMNGKEIPFVFQNNSVGINQRWSLLEDCVITWEM